MLERERDILTRIIGIVCILVKTARLQSVSMYYVYYIMASDLYIRLCLFDVTSSENRLPN